jgi:transcriptional regulator with GAF, ATPase, and Fis domain
MLASSGPLNPGTCSAWAKGLLSNSFDSVKARKLTMFVSDLIGSSAKFRALLDKIDLVAPVNSAVLIQDETGTGKRLGISSGRSRSASGQSTRRLVRAMGGIFLAF